MEDLNTNYSLNVTISDSVQNQIVEKLILVEDLEKALFNAETNKERFRNPQNSHYLTRMRIDNLTYWVEYEERTDELFVHNVYTHRMEVVEG
ncbi:hypothetical protein [Clostridium thailandense]|uniref:Uncharacterized protein n=1 Tax=Clostridium thailandense TaxID=2794346 RepID=A0A949TJM2_9CLOT|nr:hypothetical protein [Clostridium thailandense]MBV7273510.1 hypothetical protein [Clostridium thailandense]